MFLLHFNAPQLLQYNFTDIYNEKLLSIILPIMHYTSISSIAFGILLCYLILTQTPEYMKHFKIYLLPYVFNATALECVMLVFKPILMQPFFAIYSLELRNYISVKWILILFIFMSYFAMSLIDCIVGIAAERFFQCKKQRSLINGQSLIPSMLFSFFAGTSLAYLIFGIAALQFQSFQDLLILPESETRRFLEEHLKGSLDFIDPTSILIFRPDISAVNFGIGFLGFVSFIFSRYLIAAAFLLLNAIKKSQLSTAEKFKQNNQIFLKCIFAQFFGFCLLAALPAFIIVMNFYFRSKPNFVNIFCFLFMNFFGLYDIIVTVFCIQPYRNKITQILGRFWNKLFASKQPKPSIFATNFLQHITDAAMISVHS